MGSIDTQQLGLDGHREPIAIIGMACKFPQDADSPEKLWGVLMQCRSTMTPFPPERINEDAFYHPDVEHGGTVRINAQVESKSSKSCANFIIWSVSC